MIMINKVTFSKLKNVSNKEQISCAHTFGIYNERNILKLRENFLMRLIWCGLSRELFSGFV